MPSAQKTQGSGVGDGMRIGLAFALIARGAVSSSILCVPASAANLIVSYRGFSQLDHPLYLLMRPCPAEALRECERGQQQMASTDQFTVRF